MSLLKTQQQLLDALCEQGGFPHPATDLQRVETHISSLILAGEHAYKIKKPLDLGFLDFTNLATRKQCCQAELQVNHALAAPIYQTVAGIYGPAHAPRIGPLPAPAGTAVLDYAVQMQRFDRRQELDRLLARQQLPVTDMDILAKKVADFHGLAEVETEQYGRPEQVLAPMLANFTSLRSSLSGSEHATRRARLSALLDWTQAVAEQQHATLAQRQRQGYIRACHGDMHLGNMVYLTGQDGQHQLAIFDAIEFSPALRWIDIASEVAFVTMDLLARQAPTHAHRFLNQYLEHLPDDGSLAVASWYQVYRALVRAKVLALQADEASRTNNQTAPSRLWGTVDDYLHLAERLTEPRQPALWLMHGVSGSGKTYISQQLVEAVGAIRLRSDVLRKQHYGLHPEHHPDHTTQAQLYQPQARAAIYQVLLQRCETLLRHGQTVIVDATFLRAAQRQPFQALAQRLNAQFRIIACVAKPTVLHKRLAQRQHDASDANSSVLEAQFAEIQAPAPHEPRVTVTPDTPDVSAIVQELRETGS